MEVKINISQRVEWIAKRVELSQQAKDLITFQMKDLVIEVAKKIDNIID